MKICGPQAAPESFHPTAMRTPSKKSQFYFVNKSADSADLSRSDSREKSEIQHHVQQGIKRFRPRSKKAINAPNKTERASSKAAHRTGKPAAIRDPLIHLLQWTMPQPDSRSALCKLDPFCASSLSIDKRVGSLLHYYKYYYHPSQWPNEMAVLRHGLFVFEDAVLHVLRNAINDHLTMYCLLAASACRLQFVDKLPSHSLVGLENFYINEALRWMSYTINNNAFEEYENFKQLLTCILLLGSADAYRENLSGARIHLETTAQLLNARGGLDALPDDVLKAQLAMSDLFLACVHVQPCLFSCSAYDPGPVSSLVIQAYELNSSIKASSAQYLLDGSAPFIGVELRYLINAVVETHTTKTQVVTASMLPERAMSVMHWVTMRNMAIRNKLLALRELCPIGHALRISIIMWTLLAMNVTGRAKTVKIMALKLRDALNLTSSSSWAGFKHTELWIVLLGCFCARDESEIYWWFVNKCSRLLDPPILQVSADTYAAELATRLEEFQRKLFFYDATVQSSRNKKLAQTLRIL